MSDETPLPPDDAVPDMSAAELALGLLEGDERAAALRRVLGDRGFAAEVETWRGHLAQLFDLWPEVAPPSDLLGRIERSLDVPTVPLAAAIPAPRRWLWPAMTGLSSLAAAALLLMLVARPTLPTPLAPKAVATASVSASATMLVAVIAPNGSGAPVTVVYDPGVSAMRVTAQALADAQRSAELWVIAGDGVPHSLGLLPSNGGRMAVDPVNRLRMAAGATLAVSLEPIGGSPTGRPTGPVVAKGTLSQV